MLRLVSYLVFIILTLQSYACNILAKQIYERAQLDSNSGLQRLPQY